MIDHVFIAGLVCDIVGTAVLARELAVETPERYVRNASAPRDYAALAGIDPPRDRARAWASAETRVGASLVLFGVVMQAISSLQSDWSLAASSAAYAVAVAVLVVAVVMRRRLARHRLRAIFLARVDMRDEARHRFELWRAYQVDFSQRGESPDELGEWVTEATRRLGCHLGASCAQMYRLTGHVRDGEPNPRIA